MEGTIGEIRMFAGNFAPRNWAFCQGQTIAISQNTALFSILGTTFGGNGQTTFALPDFSSRVAIGTGQGPGLSSYQLGQAAGTETNTILITNMPAHNHQMQASGDGPTQGTASGASLASSTRSTSVPNIYVSGAPNQVPMASATTIAGGSQPMNNVQPYLGMNYIICLFGIFPSRN
ncbi:MAG: phage tail protein [Spirosomataceae bacterium]